MSMKTKTSQTKTCTIQDTSRNFPFFWWRSCNKAFDFFALPQNQMYLYNILQLETTYIATKSHHKYAHLTSLSCFIIIIQCLVNTVSINKTNHRIELAFLNIFTVIANSDSVQINRNSLSIWTNFINYIHPSSYESTRLRIFIYIYQQVLTSLFLSQEAQIWTPWNQVSSRQVPLQQCKDIFLAENSQRRIGG